MFIMFKSLRFIFEITRKKHKCKTVFFSRLITNYKYKKKKIRNISLLEKYCN